MLLGLGYIGIVLLIVTLSFALRRKTGVNFRRELSEAVRIYSGTTKERLVFPEERFRRKVLYWLTPGIDTTYFALVALQKLGDLYGKRDLLRFLEENEDEIEGFLTRHFDPKTGEARHNLEARPTLYGMYCGLTLLKFLKRIPIIEERIGYERAQRFLGREIVDGMIGVIHNCESSEGGFSGNTHINRPTIVNTDTALAILWNLEQKPIQSERLRDFIWSCRKFHNSTFGFANTPREQKPCVCISSYAMRSLIYLEAIVRGSRNFKSVLDDRNQKVISRTDLEALAGFVGLSMSLAKGGFAKTPGETPTLFHTDIVLNLVRSLSKQIDIGKLTDKIDLPTITSWIKDRETPIGGFSFEPKYLPNVHSTRSAVVSISNLCDLFKNQRESIVGDGFLDYRRHRRFLISCFDSKVGGFAGYTITTS